MFRVKILTVIPEYWEVVKNIGIIKQAIKEKAVSLQISNIRDFATDRHRSIDDTPYGGGGGMVIKVDVLKRAMDNIVDEGDWKMMPDVRGKSFTQNDIRRIKEKGSLFIFNPRYKGVDERSFEYFDEFFSIGDFVIAGGDFATSILVEGVVRLIDGVVGNEESIKTDSLYKMPFVGHPVYTRPKVFEKKEVKKVLLSGNHKAVEINRLRSSIFLTYKYRPDFLKGLHIEYANKTIIEEVVNGYYKAVRTRTNEKGTS